MRLLQRTYNKPANMVLPLLHFGWEEGEREKREEERGGRRKDKMEGDKGKKGEGNAGERGRRKGKGRTGGER